MIKAKILLLLGCFLMVASFGQKSKKKIKRKSSLPLATQKLSSEPTPIINSKSVQQGICGTIFWKSGNMMPSPDKPSPKGRPVQRELVIYDLTNTAETTRENGFYQSIATKYITSVMSDEEGKFCVNLEEGRYSLFVKEGNKGLYANSYDGDGNIFPIKVSKDKVTIVVFTIDYQASY
ncbi:carboxypeptidase regulatory-like domain-containing protein [Arcicella rigui]|uniref:Carboxypeptidase regulatory-like domain-containing protein n=1 Tax=Arcicella rigui TaxID=797020 RepID=A0ABU5Q447_9BACT|nr:carboxypeptidase regulatory-like domain-containing protein [Arcicella rigui]MEA5137598.1 carboxypeptidase regulatory-like domain-containing protein [Arcicella rigui]